MDKYWTFKVFITDDGGKEFINWMNGLDPITYQKIDSMIRRMELIKYWTRPYFDKIHGYTKMHEIRIAGADNVPHRLIGCFNPGVRREFIILLDAVKKNGNYDPKNLFKTAEKRIKLIKDEWRLADYE